MPLIDQNLQNTINDHDQREAIAAGIRAFSKNLVNATDMVTAASSTPRDNVTENGVADKLISKDLKDQINASSSSEQIKELLNQMAPKLLKNTRHSS
jgi:hypothetical protein